MKYIIKYNYKVVNCNKFPISFGILPDILLAFKFLSKNC